MLKYLFSAAVAFTACFAQAQNNATYKEYQKTYLTYPFSDPDPIPAEKKIYPYFRFDGFALQGEEKNWTVVELENDFISVQIMPEIGGKVWTAMEKKSGKHFFYNNEVVKFRDIAMRGPWVSGGIEVNYGIIGHTPNTATPVDYLTRSNADGSVSCFVSTLDLLTRTRWVLEIKLEKDKAYFTTRSFWFNGTETEKPYYTWMNAGIPAGDDLRFLYPGNYSIGHGGEARAWPIDKEGNNLSYYAQNNFGGSKSYHILGAHSKYFGAIWEDEDFGMIHYAKRGEKLGKKIFLWAQSEQGRIWEDLLTDDSGQYVEIQSGRLFNQNQFNSSFTPFKQIGLTPFVSEHWTEYWYPFQDIGGFSHASLLGAFNLEQSQNSLSVKISPVQYISDSLKVLNKAGQVIGRAQINASPLVPFETSLLLDKGEVPAKLMLQGHVVDLLEDDAEHSLSRPVEIAEDFKEDGAYGLTLQGRDLYQFRNYQQAEEKIRAALGKDPAFLPALVEMTKLKLFRMQYDSAFNFAKKALSIDTYHGEANYYYGIAADRLSRDYDALDGFEVSALTPGFRNAAYTALCRIYLRQDNYLQAKEYALMALRTNPDNMDALQVLHILGRLQNEEELIQKTAKEITALNPLNHFRRFENYFRSPTEKNKEDFVSMIRNEMPGETYLELAIWYANLGREEESIQVLELANPNPIGQFWLAWLTRDTDPTQSNKHLMAAREQSPLMVFPFREETAHVLEWAAKAAPSWQADYYLALIYDFRGNREQAWDLMKAHGEQIDFAPFYIFKARLNEEAPLPGILPDLFTAATQDPGQWRYGRILAGTLREMGNYSESIQVLEKHFQEDRDNYIVGMDLARTHMLAGNYPEAEAILDELHVLPFEGATDARRYYRETKLMMAHNAMEGGRYEEALKKIEAAREWPNRLGVGKPYPENINEDLENWMTALIYKETGKPEAQRKFLDQVKNKEINEENYLEMIEAVSSRRDRRMF